MGELEVSWKDSRACIQRRRRTWISKISAVRDEGGDVRLMCCLGVGAVIAVAILVAGGSREMESDMVFFFFFGCGARS